jgi:hypothetical protein
MECKFLQAGESYSFKALMSLLEAVELLTTGPGGGGI